MPEVGLSGLPLDYPHSGTATYVRQLLRHLPEVAPDLTFRLFMRWSRERFPGITVERVGSPLAPFNRGRGLGAQADKLVWEIGVLPLASALRRQVLLHSPTFAAPLTSATPVIVTIHDLIPLVLPGYHRSRQSAVYSRLMAGTVKRSLSIITVSEHSKRDIMRTLGMQEDRVRVTYEAPGAEFGPLREHGEEERVQRLYDLPGNFALYLGGSERRKNIETLVRAWGARRRELRHLGLKLLVVATFPPPDPLYPDIPALIRELELVDDVVLRDGVREEDKATLFRTAQFFCYPSRYEGFGLPPLEAMASGTPVICSDAASLPEVVGSAAYTLGPDDVEGWGEALVQLASSPAERQRLSEDGLRRAAHFSWRKTALETADIYRETLSR